MSSAQPAFGAMFREQIELGVVEINTEPLDARIEWRLKEVWENTSCPRCGHNAVQTWLHLDRVWGRDCNFKPAYTYGTPFHEKHLPAGEVLLAFTLYADTLLSINQIAPLLGRAYKPVHTAIREVEAAVQRGLPVVWELLGQTTDGRTQVDESGTVSSGYKGHEPPRNSRSRGGSSQTGRSRWRGRHGDQLTLVTACRDSLRVIRGQLGTDYQDELAPVIQEAEALSQPLGEVWTDGLQAYREMDFDHRTVVHKETYVSPDSVHVNQAECLFSLVQLWLRKFRGPSKQDSEQAAHTFGLVRSLTPVGESVESTILNQGENPAVYGGNETIRVSFAHQNASRSGDGRESDMVRTNRRRLPAETPTVSTLGDVGHSKGYVGSRHLRGSTRRAETSVRGFLGRRFPRVGSATDCGVRVVRQHGNPAHGSGTCDRTDHAVRHDRLGESQPEKPDGDDSLADGSARDSATGRSRARDEPRPAPSTSGETVLNPARQQAGFPRAGEAPSFTTGRMSPVVSLSGLSAILHKSDTTRTSDECHTPPFPLIHLHDES